MKNRYDRLLFWANAILRRCEFKKRFGRRLNTGGPLDRIEAEYKKANQSDAKEI
jgi:hypothetical protein